MTNSPVWRIIDSGTADGSTNMAVDEALLLSFQPGSSLPLLRLYGWDPPALSIGRFQDVDRELKSDLCRHDDIPVIRRISGGGAILHEHEITYSLICTPDHLPHSASIKESFRVITGFLMDFYRSFGLTAAYAIDAAPDGDMLGQRTSCCFAGRESYDITVNGTKIGGNAQRRMKQIIFQHGSIPVSSDVARALNYLRIPHTGDLKATTLRRCGVTESYAGMKERLLTSFTGYFGIHIAPGPLTPAESSLAERLRRDKYLNLQWNSGGNVP